MRYGFVVARKHTDHLVARLLAAFHGEQTRDCPSEMLKALANHLNAFGAILWQATEDTELQSRPPRGNLFMLATWFPVKEIFAIHNLSYEGTVAGPAVVQKTPKIVNDLPKDGGEHRNHPFLKRHDLTRVVAVPFKYTDRTDGAITIYRKSTQPKFLQREVKEVKGAIRQLTSLMRAAQEMSRLKLLEVITSYLQEPKLSSEEVDIRTKEWPKTLDRICSEIFKVFHAAETTIILRRNEGSPEFRPVAIKTSPEHRRRVRKHTWKADAAEERFTSLVLATREPVRLFDLRNCGEDIRRIQQKHPEFQWTAAASLEEDARSALGKDYSDPKTKLPPLAFLVVPIMVGDRLHGCIRCWIARPPLSYFSDHDERLLERVAGQIGLQCEAMARNAETSSEIAVWRKLDHAWNSASASGPISHPKARMIGRAPTVDPFTVFLLSLLQEVIPGADANALWIASDTGVLNCVAAPLLHPGEERAAEQARKWQRYVYRSIEASAADEIARVWKTKESRSISRGNPEFSAEQLFPSVVRVLTVPVRSKEKEVGILQIGSSSGEPFPVSAESAAGFIANLLAYHLLAKDALSKAERSQLERAQTDKFVNEAFRDILHQMKGPLLSCAQQIRELSLQLGAGSPLGTKASLAAQMAESAARVSRRVGIFADLSQKNTVQAARQTMSPQELVFLLREAWRNVSYRVHPRRNLSFSADFDQIRRCIPEEFVTDPELLLHAIQNIIDNAAKYSYSGNQVRLEASKTRTGWMLTVINKGIPITPAEIQRVRQRGWRGQIAQLTTGEGSGIGLWIVDRVILALGAQLQIHPTDKSGWTRVSIVFPNQPFTTVPS